MSVSDNMRHQELMRLLPLVSLDSLKDLSLKDIQKLEVALANARLTTQRALALKTAGSKTTIIKFN